MSQNTSVWDTDGGQVIRFFRSGSKSVLPHEHDFLELAYVLDGEAIHKINGANDIRIRRGDYFIIDYKTEHEYRSTGGDLCVINCLFLPQLLDKSLLYCHDFGTLLRHYMLHLQYDSTNLTVENRIFHDDDGVVLRILEQMQREYDADAVGRREMLRAYLIEIIITAARNILTGKETGGIIGQIEAEIYRSYDKKTTLSELGAKYSYSLPYLSKKFKEETGMTYREYVTRVRINEACRLLANTDKKITEIAATVGYTDTDFFYRVFKNRTGHTPMQLRRAVLKE